MGCRVARSLVLLLPAAATAALLLAACGSSSAEQQILTNFFRAARVRDNATLANIAAVNFNPRTEGVVQDFEIVEMGEERRRTLQLRELADAEARAREEEAEFTKKRMEFQASNKDALDRVAKAQSAQQPVRGRDADVLAAQTKWREEHTQFQRRLSDARNKLASERAQAASSLTPPGQPDVDVSEMTVELITKRATIAADVRTPEGQTVGKTFVITFQRAVGKQGDRTREGRWIITGLQEQGAAAPSS